MVTHTDSYCTDARLPARSSVKARAALAPGPCWLQLSRRVREFVTVLRCATVSHFSPTRPFQCDSNAEICRNLTAGNVGHPESSVILSLSLGTEALIHKSPKRASLASPAERSFPEEGAPATWIRAFFGICRVPAPSAAVDSQAPAK